MPLEDIIGLCIGVPCLIALIILLYIFIISCAKSQDKLNKTKNLFYEKKIERLQQEINFFDRKENKK